MSGSALRDLPRALLHVGRARALEVFLLQASPLLGAAFGGGLASMGQLLALLAGSVLLTAHVFAFNDWAGHRGDLNDPRRADRVFSHHGIDSGAVATLSVALLAASMLGLGSLGFTAVVLGAGIAGLGLVYSDTEVAGKGTPVFASVLHLAGGAAHFLLGYSVGRTVDARGLGIAVFFGLVFAGGHLNQEVRDHEADRHNGIRTTAVAIGPRRAMVASLVVFSAAYGTLLVLAVFGLVPPLVSWVVALVWPLHVLWSFRAWRGGAAVEEARWLQVRYRLLFAVVGLAMALSLVPLPGLAQPSP
jgi:4-hydroxybenzoate polyprenyltransferase